MTNLIVAPIFLTVHKTGFSNISDQKPENVYYVSFPRNKKSVSEIADSM